MTDLIKILQKQVALQGHHHVATALDGALEAVEAIVDAKERKGVAP